MTNERYVLLRTNEDEQLTKEEIKEGWHFCDDYDGLLIGPKMPELHICCCLPREHSVYKTIIDDDVIGNWDLKP